MSIENHHHITPLKTFLKVYASLVVLTFLTVYTATQVNLGHFNTPLAMLIAVTKSMLVVLWFMHLKTDSKINKVTISTAVFFLFVFFGFTAADVFTRQNLQDVSMEHLTEKVKAEETAAPAPAEPPAEHAEH